MAWYDIPKVKIQYVNSENGVVDGVLMSAADFEKLVEKMEDFLDHIAIERAKKEPIKFYTHAEIKKLIEKKKR